MTMNDKRGEQPGQDQTADVGDVLRQAHVDRQLANLETHDAANPVASGEPEEQADSLPLSTADAGVPEQAADIEGPGAILHAARERRGLSQSALAQFLNLDLNIVQALEAEAFDRLPGPTYVRGYLRAWARQLEIDEDSLLAAYDRVADQESEPGRPTLTETAGPIRSRKSGRGRTILLVLALLLAGGAVAWWYLSQSAIPEAIEDAPAPAGEASSGQGEAVATPGAGAEAPEQSMVEEPAPESAADIEPAAPRESAPAPRETASEPMPDNDPANTTAADEAVTVEAPASMAESNTPVAEAAADSAGTEPAGAQAEAEAPAEAAPAEPAVAETEAADETAATEPAPTSETLILRAEGGDSWVELEDAAGERLMFDILKDGESRQMEGQPPFKVFIGNSPVVALEYRGEPFDQSGFEKSNRTARFTVGGE